MINISNRTVYFLLTGRCNQECRYCYYSTGYLKLKDRQDYPLQEAEALFSALKEWRFREISFTGGEPYLHPHLFDFINIAHNMGFITTLCTNGTLLDLEGVISLREQGLNNIYFSIDSLEEGVHNHNRKDFKKALRALQFALKTHFDLIGINATITGQNYNTFDELMKFCYSHHISLNICPAWLPEDSHLYADISLNPYQKKEFLATAQRWIKEYGTDYFFKLAQIFFRDAVGDSVPGLPGISVIPGICQAAVNDLVIYPNGDIFACFYNSKSFLGNFFKQSFSQIVDNRSAFIDILDARNCCSKYCLNLVFE